MRLYRNGSVSPSSSKRFKTDCKVTALKLIGLKNLPSRNCGNRSDHLVLLLAFQVVTFHAKLRQALALSTVAGDLAKASQSFPRAPHQHQWRSVCLDRERQQLILQGHSYAWAKDHVLLFLKCNSMVAGNNQARRLSPTGGVGEFKTISGLEASRRSCQR